MVEFWRKHSLSIVLVIVFIAMSVAYWFFGLADWKSDQLAHGDPAQVWPGYARHYVAEMLVSNVADVFGAIVLVLFTKSLYEKGSAESN